MKLSTAASKIREQKLKGESLSGIIKTVCYKNNRADVIQWLSEHSYFGSLYDVIYGVNDSNKWGMLDDEILDLCKGNRRYIIEMGLCRLLRKKPVSVNDLKACGLSFAEALSAYGAIDRWFKGAPCTLSGHLNELGSWSDYFIDEVNCIIPKEYGEVLAPGQSEYQLIIDHFQKDLGFPKEDERKQDLRNIFKELRTTLFKLLVEEVDKQQTFSKGLFIATCFEDISFGSHSQTAVANWVSLEKEVAYGLYNIVNGQTRHDVKKSSYRLLGEFIKEFWSLEAFEGSRWEPIIAFREIQLELFFVGSYPSEKVKRVNILDQYFNRLIDMGFIKEEKNSMSFKWPMLKTLSQEINNDKSEDVFGDFAEFSLLRKAGYQVGKSGGPQYVRRQILTDFYEGTSKLETEIEKEWQGPFTFGRLKKMVYHISHQVSIQKKLGNHAAVSDWESDLKFLKKKYYDTNSSMTFKFPDLKELNR